MYNIHIQNRKSQIANPGITSILLTIQLHFLCNPSQTVRWWLVVGGLVIWYEAISNLRGNYALQFSHILLFSIRRQKQFYVARLSAELICDLIGWNLVLISNRLEFYFFRTTCVNSQLTKCKHYTIIKNCMDYWVEQILKKMAKWQKTDRNFIEYLEFGIPFLGIFQMERWNHNQNNKKFFSKSFPTTESPVVTCISERTGNQT